MTCSCAFKKIVELVQGKLSDVLLPEAKLLITSIFLCSLSTGTPVLLPDTSMRFPLLRGNRELLTWMTAFLRAFASMTLVWFIESLFGLVWNRKKASIPILPSLMGRVGVGGKNRRLKMYSVLLFDQNCKPRCLYAHRKCAPSLQIPLIIHWDVGKQVGFHLQN